MAPAFNAQATITLERNGTLGVHEGCKGAPHMQTPTGQSEPQRPPLLRIPIEILLSIVDFLSPEDVLCLAFCSVDLWSILEGRRKKFSLVGHKKLPLLRRLEYDALAYFACACCSMLHMYESSRLSPRSSPTETLPCIRDGRWKTPELGFMLFRKDLDPPYELNFLMVQLAMRRFHHGPQTGITCESLNYAQVRSRGGTYQLPVMVSIEARIFPKKWISVRAPQSECSLESVSSPPSASQPWNARFSKIGSDTHQLCLRVQEIDFVLTSFLCPGTVTVNHRFKICYHSQALGVVIPQQLLEHSAHDDGYRKIGGSCPVCHVIFEIGVVTIGEYTALVLTRWFNLGAGLTPEDPRWMAHCDPNYPELPRDDAINPREAFESNGSPHSSNQALLNGNLDYLKYRKAMDRRDVVTWQNADYDSCDLILPHESYNPREVNSRPPTR
ncbi:unnamed protein product [Penicillium olsonii]|nr:unnamed protein product [Penicillium olsonii]